MKTTFLFTSMLISVGLSTESEIPPDKVNTLGLRAGAFDNRPGTCFDTNHFVHIINRRKANDKGTEKHDKTSKNRTLWTRNQSVHSLRLPLIIHHPVNQFKKVPWIWLHWRTIVRTLSAIFSALKMSSSFSLSNALWLFSRVFFSSGEQELDDHDSGLSFRLSGIAKSHQWYNLWRSTKTASYSFGIPRGLPTGQIVGNCSTYSVINTKCTSFSDVKSVCYWPQAFRVLKYP